jgi:hypothetical protein
MVFQETNAAFHSNKPTQQWKTRCTNEQFRLKVSIVPNNCKK